MRFARATDIPGGQTDSDGESLYCIAEADT